MLKIIIPTCDKYRNILEAVKYTFDRYYCNLNIIVLGYKKPDFDLGQWRFVSLGEDTGAQNFSNDLFKFFNDFDDEYFIYGNDDGLLVNTFNTKFLFEIHRLVKDIPHFGRMWLTRTPSDFYGGSGIIKSFDNYSIGEVNQWADYRLSLQCSLWKTSYFKKYLTPNLNPWQWELRETAKYDNAAILLPINNSVVSLGHVMKKGKLLNDWHRSIYGEAELNPEDIEKIIGIFRKHSVMK